MVRVGRFSESPLDRCWLVGHSRLSLLSADSLMEKISSAYSARRPSAPSHMPVTHRLSKRLVRWCLHAHTIFELHGR